MKLKIGDIIYSYRFGNITSRLKINRITNNYAFYGKLKFRIEYDNNYIHSVPHDTWNTISYFISTPTRDMEFKNAYIASMVSLYIENNIKKIPADVLEDIYNTIKPYMEEK